MIRRCLLTIIVMLAAMACLSGALITYSNHPQEVFERELINPIPVSVTNLQGGDFAWQGADMWLRFSTDQDTLDQILANGYVSVKCPNILNKLTFEPEDLSFSPPWEPETVIASACYMLQKTIYGNATADYFILVDPVTMTVYFHGIVP